MSDEVSDFLRSVELLKERREEEDEARSRDLEEKILQEKKERQARRAGTPDPVTASHRAASPPPAKTSNRIGVRVPSRNYALGDPGELGALFTGFPCPPALHCALFFWTEALITFFCRAREIDFTAKVLTRKYAAANSTPREHHPVCFRRHNFGITRA